MELNITVGVQVVNFLVAWRLLHVLYFKPAIQYLYDKQKKYDQLVNMMYHWQSCITKQEHEIDAAWRKLTLFSRQHKPHITRNIDTLPLHISSDESFSVDFKEVELLTQEIKKLVVQEVVHVEL